MKKITPSKKKTISNHWNQKYPGLVLYKSMWLLRRIGPLLQGICLDRDSTNANYLPTFHVHNLIGQEDDFISLSLKRVLVKSNGTPQRITEMQHDKNFEEYIKEFNGIVPFCFAGDIKLKAIVKAYEQEINNGRADTKYPLQQWYDLVCLYLWAGKKKDAEKLFIKAKQSIELWPVEVTGYIKDRIDKFMLLQAYIEKPLRLPDLVEQALEVLKLDDLPSSEIL